MKPLLVCLLVVGCRAPQATSVPTDGKGSNGSDGSIDSSSPPDAPVVAVDDLRFAVIGDTRPKYVDDTPGYPVAIITRIYQDIEAESPHPVFAVATGDYMFASYTTNHQQEQLDLYMHARSAFSGALYPVLGNHECTGSTASNCGAGTTDGVTKNFSTFLATMLQPIAVTSPYYVEHFSDHAGTWSAKVVAIACNSWTQAQADWLDTALSEPTTYTFVVRHEGNDATAAPCLSPSRTIMANHPLTLLIVGHSHLYRHVASEREVVIGLGGAPLTSGSNYGYSIVARDPGGTITVTTYDYQSHATLDTFTIAADGTHA